MYADSLQDPAFSSFAYIPRSEIARSYGNSVSNFLREFLFLIVPTPFTIPIIRVWGSSFSVSLSTLVTVCLIDDSHPSGCEVVSHCGFDLPFPDD